MDPKWTQIDAQVALETMSKNMLKNAAFFDPKLGPVWDNFLSKNAEKGAVLKGTIGSESRPLLFY